MAKFVKIPVVEKKRPILTRISIYSFIICCVFLFLTIIFANSKTLTITSIFLVIVSGIGTLLFKKFSIEGYLILYPDNIMIKTKSLNQNIAISHLSELKFLFGGFEEDFYILNPKSISLKDGTDNFLILQNEKEKYSLELLLSKNDFKSLSNLFTYWKKINPNFVIIGEWGFKVESL